MRKGVSNTYINVVKVMYEVSCTSVNSMCEETKDFKVGVGVHQIFVLSPYIFSVVMDEVVKKI